MSEKINAARQVEGGTGTGSAGLDREAVEAAVAAMFTHGLNTGVSAQYVDNGVDAGQLIFSTTAAFQYSLVFNAIDTIGPDLITSSTSIRQVIKSAGVATVRYSTDGGLNYSPPLTFTGNTFSGQRTVAAGTELFWKITFNTALNPATGAAYNAGTIIVRGQ